MDKKNLENLEDDDVMEALRKLGVVDEGEEAVAEPDEKQDGETSDEVTTDEDSDIEESTEDESDVVEPQTKTLSKEEKAILALKKELKLAKQLLKEKADESERVASEQRKANVIQSYKDKGYDEETAVLYANNELKMKVLEEKLAVTEFKEENAEVLAKYPEAKSDLKWLMDAVEKTGLSAEQLCRGKYGDSMNKSDRRADDAMRGRIDDSIEDVASSAIRSANRQVEQSLTESDRRNKAQLEKLSGVKISPKDYLNYYKKNFKL